MKIGTRNYSKADVLRRVGDISQLGGVRETTLSDGRGRGLRCLQVDTGGGLRFCILPERCMDIAWADFRGTPLSFITKAGISSSAYFTHWKEEFHRVFAGGLLTTCGLRNIGRYGDYEGEHFGQHGRIGNAPAEHLSVSCGWVGDEYEIILSAQMREAVLYEENLYLSRTIRTRLGSGSFVLEDTISNLAFREEYVDILYHMNFGFPLLDEGARIILPKGWYTDPETNEQCSLSQLSSTVMPPADGADSTGYPIEFEEEQVRIELRNPSLKDWKGIYLSYPKTQLARFALWKSSGSGDYVLGLEPGTSVPEGRENNRKSGTMICLGPMEEHKVRIEFGIIMEEEE